jgi:hypothetical protein
VLFPRGACDDSWTETCRDRYCHQNVTRDGDHTTVGIHALMIQKHTDALFSTNLRQLRLACKNVDAYIHIYWTCRSVCTTVVVVAGVSSAFDQSCRALDGDAIQCPILVPQARLPPAHAKRQTSGDSVSESETSEL